MLVKFSYFIKNFNIFKGQLACCQEMDDIIDISLVSLCFGLEHVSLAQASLCQKRQKNAFR